MKPTEYESNVLITESNDLHTISQRMSQSNMVRLLHAALGLGSEIAELREALDESQNTAMIDYVNLREEAGDLSWYTAVAINALSLDPASIWPLQSSNSLFSGLPALSSTVNALTVSVGEFENLLKRVVFYGKPLDRDKFQEVLIGIAEGIGALSLHAGSTLDEVTDINIAKLKARYGEKFSEAAALNRDLVKERTILEQK